MRRFSYLIAGLALLFATAALPRRASADTSIADLLPAATATPAPSATPTPTAAPTSAPVATATPTPSGLADTGVDSTVPFAMASLGIVGLSAFQLRRRRR